MSTVIGNGRRIRHGMDETYALLMAAKPEATAIAAAIQTEWYAVRTSRMIDTARIAGETAKHPLHTAWIEMDDRRTSIRLSSRRDPAVDVDFELWLFPRGKDVLLIRNAEQRRLCEWFDALPFVDDHAWWDNADREESVSRGTWNARRRDWDAVLPPGSVPADRCLVMSLCGPDRMPPDPRAVLSAIRPTAERIESLAREQRANDIARTLADPGNANPDVWETMRLHSRATTMIDDDPVAMEAVRERIASFVKDISMQDLRGTS